MTKASNKVGRWGEEKAAQYLLSKGYEILGRNVHTPYGEIDILAQEQQKGMQENNQDVRITVFVEVKTRQSERYGYPEEAVTFSKQKHLLASAEWYLLGHPEYDGDWRVDVIAISKYGNNLEDVKLLHLVDVITTETSSPWNE
jgi:putative endonuclease